MDDVQRIAEGLAARLNRAVAIDDPQMRLLAHTSHREDVDELRVESIMRMEVPRHVVEHVLSHGIAQATEPVRVPAAPEIGMLARVAAPVRCQGLLLGYLWLIDTDGTLTDAELVAAQEAADAAGQVLYRQQLLGDLRDSRERELLRDLLSEDATLHAPAAAALIDEEIVSRSSTATALVVTVSPALEDAARSAMDPVLRAVARRAPQPGLGLARGNGRGVLVLCSRRGPTSAQLRAVATDVRDSLLHALHASKGVAVGVGPTVVSLTDAATSARRAREAVAVAGAIRGLGDVVAWENLGVYKLLARLPQHDIEDTLPEGLVRLFETDKAGVLVETLETWLDKGGDPRETIAVLSIHRTSLYYRLNRIEEVTGMTLAVGDDRLALHLGLKVARLLGQLTPRS